MLWNRRKNQEAERERQLALREESERVANEKAAEVLRRAEIERLANESYFSTLCK